MSDFDGEPVTGADLKVEGMALAARAEDEKNSAWREHALLRIHQTARECEYFDADDVRQRGVEEPEHHSAWGSVWQTARKRGLIEETTDVPRRKSSRRAAHASTMTAYRSLVWEGL